MVGYSYDLWLPTVIVVWLSIFMVVWLSIGAAEQPPVVKGYLIPTHSSPKVGLQLNEKGSTAHPTPAYASQFTARALPREMPSLYSEDFPQFTFDGWVRGWGHSMQYFSRVNWWRLPTLTWSGSPTHFAIVSFPNPLAPECALLIVLCAYGNIATEG